MIPKGRQIKASATMAGVFLPEPAGFALTFPANKKLTANRTTKFFLYRSISTSNALHTPFSKKVNLAEPKVQLAIRALRSYINAVEQKNHTWETACHLSALVLVAGLVPAANVLAPLIIWIIRKNQSPGTDRHGRAVLNFQLAMTLYFSILFLLSKINGLEVPVGICLRAWAYINIFLILRGGYQAAKGDLFKYPFSIRFFPQ